MRKVQKGDSMTHKQEEVFTYVLEYFKENMASPTYRNIAKRFNMTVKGSYDHVQAIIKRGYFVKISNRFVPSPEIYTITKRRNREQKKAEAVNHVS